MTESCGTPERTDNRSEVVPFSTTCCVLPARSLGSDLDLPICLVVHDAILSHHCHSLEVGTSCV